MERGEVVTVAQPRAVGVSVEGVTKQFADKVALDGVSLDVAPGTFLVLLGPSGSGKTTLLRCLAGIERPSAGVITIDDRVVVGPREFVAPEKRGLAMVFQDYALWPHLTVAKNVAFPLATSRRTKAERAARVTDLLERVGIAHLAERFPNELSGGEQQRVALARALSAEVGLVLFDEPLSNLDADRREQLRVEIATLIRAAGVTAVYITHDQSEAFALADRVGVLNHGRLIQLDTPEAIYKRPINAFVARFTGLAGEFAVSSVTMTGADRYDVTLPFAPNQRVSATATQSIERGDAVNLFVRSAGVTLHDASEPRGVPGVVADAAFNGRGYDHVVRVGPRDVLSKVFSSHRFDRDHAVKVCFDSSSCFVMNPGRVSS
ncbi:MAG: ABC transporter ATP-binding protein [Acidimicrobiales bacterium]